MFYHFVSFIFLFSSKKTRILFGYFANQTESRVIYKKLGKKLLKSGLKLGRKWEKRVKMGSNLVTYRQ
jgi:hypothetical protein